MRAKDYLKRYWFSLVYCLTWSGDLQTKFVSSGPSWDCYLGRCCHREGRSGPEGRFSSVIFICLVIFVLLWKLLGRLKILSPLCAPHLLGEPSDVTLTVNRGVGWPLDGPSSFWRKPMAKGWPCWRTAAISVNPEWEPTFCRQSGSLGVGWQQKFVIYLVMCILASPSGLVTFLLVQQLPLGCSVQLRFLGAIHPQRRTVMPLLGRTCEQM